MHERHPGGQRGRLRHHREVMGLLDRRGREQRETGLPDRHHVGVVAEDGQSLRRHRPGRHVQHRREGVFDRGKHAFGVNAVFHIPFLGEMINHRRLVDDASLTARHHVRKVIVLLQSLSRLGQNCVELSPERTVLDIFNLTRQIDPAVPNFHGRQLRQSTHASSIGFNCCCRSCTRSFLRKSLGKCSHCYTRGKSFEVNREIDAGQGLIEIIDVKQDTLLGGDESSKVHQMTIATRVDGKPDARLMS